uniref:VTT domain-containing protein n=1 Tax=Chenopodium quinoa TaxID=63459 RepID=A0A803LHD0_CHEQI
MRSLLILRPPSPYISSLSSSNSPSSSLSPPPTTTRSSRTCGRLTRRFQFLSPSCSSSKKQQQQTSQTTLQKSPPPQSLRRLLNWNPKPEDDDTKSDDSGSKDGVEEGELEGDTAIKGYGPAGYALFVLVYAGLEVLAIPAIPLTMSAGLLFGSVTGTVLVSISGTLAASIAFLIARYFARERILKLVEGNKKFKAIDKAIGENGFRIVALLRLSPLLPFSLGNYLYGLTSVKFVPYVLASWLGMLPGTWAYVNAGAFGRAIIQEETGVGVTGGNGQLLTLGLGLLATALAASYVTKLAKDAMKDIE